MHAIGQQIIRLEEAASTNTLVLGRTEYLETPGLVVLARHQTGGRGRMGRQWVSLPGRQLQFSVVLHPRMPVGDLPAVALVAGLAVAQAIRGMLPLKPQLKWPNDVLVAERKVCGILVEGQPGPRNAPRLVVGIGINCNGAAEDFPPELRERLTTLAAQAGQEVAPDPLLEATLRALEAGLNRLEQGDKPGLLADWRAWALLGAARRVRVPTHTGGVPGVAEGYAEDITAEGYLLVRLPDGTRVTQVSGELDWLG